jgi:hypothetical protein
VSDDWTLAPWPVGQLTDGELHTGIARCESALKRLDTDASARTTIAARLEEYQAELDTRRKARKAQRTSAARVW